VAKGYLDDLSGDLYGETDNPDLEKTREATDAKETDRYGVQVRVPCVLKFYTSIWLDSHIYTQTFP